MKTKFFIALCFALTWNVVEVYADGELEVRRGLFPYMAFLYYPDESVVDGTGARFLRGAILIRPDWLVTSAVGPSIVQDAPNGFPRKTLLARVGAVTIDTNFTLNEDEDEQEREVIRIVRPYNNSATQWWSTDISLMKVLLAFNLTTAVGFATLNPTKHDFADKSCIILVYAKRNSNVTEDRSLMQINVEMQPPSVENCGSHFIGNTMACATDSEESKNAVYDSNFCQGNSGGPLICENEVVAIQTYIDNNCKQPHLYQLLSGWDQLISCGTEDTCEEKKCSQICDVANKDIPTTTTTGTTEKSKEMLMEAESISVPQATSSIPETTTEDSESLTMSQSQTPDEISTTDSSSMLVPTPTHFPDGESEESKSWPNERKTLEQGDAENVERKANVEAQHHELHVPKYSSGGRNVFNTLSLFFGLFILACLV